MASSTKRTAAMKILLAPEIDQSLRQLAERLGQTPATLASLAVSQYVATQQANFGAAERVAAGFLQSLAPELLGMLKDAPEPSPEALLGMTQPPVQKKAAQ